MSRISARPAKFSDAVRIRRVSTWEKSPPRAMHTRPNESTATMDAMLCPNDDGSHATLAAAGFFITTAGFMARGTG